MSAGAPSMQAGAAIAWSPDGERLAIGGDDEITVFDASLRPTLRLRTGEQVPSLAFTAGDGLLCAGLDGGAVRVFDAWSGAALRNLQPHGGPVRALAVAPDGHTLASAGDDGVVHLWDPATGVELRSLRPPRGAAVLAFDAAGARLATAGDDGRISLWDLPGGALAGTVPARGGVRAMALAGDRLDVITAEAHLRWDVSRPRAPRLVTRAPDDDGGASLAFDAAHALLERASADHGGLVAFALTQPAGALAAVYRDRSVAILPVGHDAEPRVIASSGPVDALAAAPDGATLAAAAGGRVLVWRVGREPHDPAGALHAHELGDARALAFSPDGKTLAMGLDRERVFLRDLSGRRPDLFLEAGGAVQSVAFSPDGARVAAGTAAPSVQILEAREHGAARLLRLEAGPVRSVRFSPDGASVLIASKEGVTLWIPAAGEGMRFVPYGPEARDAAFTPDGAGMAVADQRGELLLGKPSASAPAPAQRVLVAAQVMALAFASDGTLATAEGNRAVVLRSPAGKAIAALPRSGRFGARARLRPGARGGRARRREHPPPSRAGRGRRRHPPGGPGARREAARGAGDRAGRAPRISWAPTPRPRARPCAAGWARRSTRSRSAPSSSRSRGCSPSCSPGRIRPRPSPDRGSRVAYATRIVQRYSLRCTAVSESSASLGVPGETNLGPSWRRVASAAARPAWKKRSVWLLHSPSRMSSRGTST